MRCTDAREHMATLTDSRHLAGAPDLSRHLEGCPSCSEAWRGHLSLLAGLAAPPPLPPFPDLVQPVLSRLERREGHHPDAWRRLAAAALAIAALALGYLWGVAATRAAAPAQDAVTATYQEALSGLPSGSAEVAYLGGGSSAQPASYRSSP